MMWISRSKRVPVTIILLVVLIVVGTLVAHARGAKPTAGSTYTGTVVVQTASGAVAQRLGMTFAVNADASRISQVHLPGGLPRPASCVRGRLGGISVGASSAPIAAPSSFHLLAPLSQAGRRVGTLVLSGAFHTFGRESGALSTTFTDAGLSHCGTGAGYTAKAGS